MSSPDQELHLAIVAKLKTVPELADIKVYDRVEPKAKFPYIQIGESQVIKQPADCLRSWKVYQTLHVWARDVPSTEAKRIVGIIDDAIDEQAINLSSLRLIMIQQQSSRVFRDPDGITHHGVIEFLATIEKLRT